MEKQRPHYPLNSVKAVTGTEETLSIKVRAIRDAAHLGFDRAAIAAVIAGLTPKMFYKSMTTYADHRSWQDVYHAPARGFVLYVKIQGDVITEFAVVSFKEK